MTGGSKAEPTGYSRMAAGLAAWPAAQPPVLVTVVSTEEEFDWTAPFDRNATAVSAAASLPHGQAMFDEFGVRPTYVVDYPIASNPSSRSVLAAIQDSGRCEIGAHLHPWVSPPHDEQVSAQASFPGNLPAELERRKLAQLSETIERHFGRRPVVYQAGRYGFGARTAAILEELGYQVDLSSSPAFDFRSEGGPDYSRLDPRPFWFGTRADLLAVPITGAFVGFCARIGPALYRRAESPGLRRARLGGVLSRTGALERMRLSPEGYSFGDLERLTRALLDRGVRVFVFSLHSPSFHPGCTPYVRDERELAAFLETCRRYYRYFFARLGGRSLTASELRSELLPLRGQPR